MLTLHVLILIFNYISVAVLCLTLVWFIYYQKFAKYLRNIPGPAAWPIFGNALMFADSTATLETFGKIFDTYGKITRVWIGTEPIILISDYKATEKVLSSSTLIEKSRLYKFLHSWLGAGLLTAGGARWRKHRRMLTPSYHLQILEQFVPTFNKVSSHLVREFRQIEDKTAIDIYPLITLATLDVICETAMGVSINALENKRSAYVRSVQEMGLIVMDRICSPIQQNDFLYKFTQNYQKEREALKVLHGHTWSVIKSRKEELKHSLPESEDIEDDYGMKKRKAFLDMLLQTRDNDRHVLSDTEIREEVDTFMLEGHDTTSSALSFTLFEVANNLHVQLKIVQELYEIFGDNDREATFQDLTNMKYLEMVIKESLRLYPSVPIFARTALEDFQLTDNIWCPKGSTIGVLAYHIHRDPAYFPEPEMFNPERFTAANQNGNFAYSYVPFSAGPRNCIGQKFAQLELKCMLSKIVRHFELYPIVPAHKVKVVAEAILTSSNGMVIRMNERRRKLSSYI